MNPIDDLCNLSLAAFLILMLAGIVERWIRKIE
jgi:hypothetical protein